MAQAQLSLSWEAHQRNICSGLSSLQQNGEFVDMTLAADGHLVKVHQVIIALASPYIKELIATAHCPHPVIFLNKISYQTLSAILEYIYTGEVLVSMENLNELVQAGKELHIRGLEDMKIHQSLQRKETPMDDDPVYEERLDDDICYLEVTDPNHDNETSDIYSSNSFVISKPDVAGELDDKLYIDHGMQDLPAKEIIDKRLSRTSILKPDTGANVGTMQYTVSNQGSLQMILNRFMYYLKHTNRDGSRQWRCVDYLSASRCPAHLLTKDDVVLQRIQSHIHPFHDQRILKKVRDSAIFSAIQDAEFEGQSKKNSKMENIDKDLSSTIQ